MTPRQMIDVITQRQWFFNRQLSDEEPVQKTKRKERGRASTSFMGLPFDFPYHFLAASLLTSWTSYVLIHLVLDLLLLR